MPLGTYTNLALAEQLLDALDTLFGLHPGFRPAHAKGLMCSGTFTPAPEAAKLTRAPHAGRPSTPVTVRYSDSTGVPTIPDNDPQRSGPRGIAVRFHLGDHAHTDIVAHSTNGFPTRTGEEFLEFLRAAIAAGAGKPEALGAFLASHPGAKRFVEAPKPIPTSFAREAFFAVTAFRFTNADGVSRHGRFRIRHEAGTEYLADEEAARKPANFLFDEIGPRLAKGPVRLGVFVQMAAAGDDVTLVGISCMQMECLRAARYLADVGIAAEVIDPIWLSPLDTDTVAESVEKTGRLLVVDTVQPSAPLSAERWVR